MRWLVMLVAAWLCGCAVTADHTCLVVESNGVITEHDRCLGLRLRL